MIIQGKLMARFMIRHSRRYVCSVSVHHNLKVVSPDRSRFQSHMSQLDSMCHFWSVGYSIEHPQTNVIPILRESNSRLLKRFQLYIGHSQLAFAQ